MSKLKLSFMALLVFCLTLLGGAGALAADNDNRIEVSAGAVIEVAPDMAYINFTAKGEGNTAAEAVNAAAKQMEAARRSLLGLNIVGQDVATVNYYTNAVFDAKGKRTGYAAENIVRVTVKDITKVGAVLDKITGAGVSKVSSISFTLQDKNLYRSRLLAQAVENARQQAAVVANAGGRSLGNLLSASFSSVNYMERSMPRAVMLNKMAAGAEDASTEIEARNISVSVNVQTCFALQ